MTASELPPACIGVIGGLGTEATLDFFGKIVRNTDVEREQEHVRVIIDNDPTYPDRNHAVFGEGPSPAAQLKTAALRLAIAGATHLVMPCNTAHAFSRYIGEVTQLPFLNMIEETVAFINKKYPDLFRIGVLETDGCRRAGLYSQMLARAGLTPVLPDQSSQARIMHIIYEVKAGGKRDAMGEKIVQEANRLANAGAQAIIAACTEIPIILAQSDIDIPLFDSTEILARRCVEIAAPQRLKTGETDYG